MIDNIPDHHETEEKGLIWGDVLVLYGFHMIRWMQ